MKRMFLKLSATVLVIAMLSTMQTSQQVVAAPKDNKKPDFKTIEKLEKINQDNREKETQPPQYNENEYIVIKNKGISTQSFLNKIEKAAPKAKIRKQSLKDKAFGIAKQYKKQKQDIDKRNAYQSKAKDKPVSIKTSAPTVVSEPTVFVTKDAANSDKTAEENTPVPEITAAETAVATEKDDPSANVKEVFLVEAEKSEIDAIKKMEDVVCVEPNNRVSAFGTNYIPWGVKAVGGEYAHSRNVKGNGVKVAVIDSGILQHPDLSITGGYNFIDNNGDYTDNQGHGTFVAGIINAQLDKMGIAGIAPSADLYALKVVDDGLTGSLSDVIEGIYWCIENDMDIINMSFGTENNSQALQLAVKDAKNAGILMVASSGNGTEEITYPAKYDEVIAVGAIDNNYKAADFSAKGDKLEFVAPGADIYSTDRENTYSSKSGTSYSAAHVTGIAVGIFSIDTRKSAAFVRTLMKESARNLGAKKDYGYGMPDLRQAIDTYDEFAKNFKDEKLDKDWTKPVFDYSKVKAKDDKIKLFDEPVWFEEARTVKSSPVLLPNNHTNKYTISKNGAKRIKVHFKYIETEPINDTVSTDTSADGTYSGYIIDKTSKATNPDEVNPKIPSNTIEIGVKTNASVQSKGFEIDKIYYEPNDIPTAPFKVIAKEDPNKTGNVLLSWRAAYDSDKIWKYEILQIDGPTVQLKGTYTGFKQTDIDLSYSFTPTANSGYNKFVVAAYDAFGNYSDYSKVSEYNRFDPGIERVVVQQPMATGTPKVIAKYDNGTYATAAPNVPINTSCEILIDFYDAESAFVRVNSENVYRNWVGGAYTTNRVIKVPYTFRAKGSNKVKLELINQKGKQVSKTLDINVTDTSAAPAVPSISKTANEELFYGQPGVNTATGNYCLSNTDIEFTYPSMIESIQRTYNARKNTSGVFGRGWSMSLEGKVTQSGSQYRVFYGNGSEEVFSLQTTGKYVSAGSHNILETGTASIGGVSTAYRVVEPSGYTYGYNASGYLVLFKHRFGDVYKITLDTGNRPSKFTGPSGRYIDIVYNADGLLESMTDDTDRYSKYSYNNKKQLVTWVSGSSRSVYYNYNSNGLLYQILKQTETWDATKFITLRGDTITYDASFRAANEKYLNDQTVYYTYNQSYLNESGFTKVTRNSILGFSNQLLPETPTGLDQYFKYDANLNLTQEVNEIGERTYYNVNQYGEVTKCFDKLGNESYTEYDSNGNVIKTVTPSGYTRYFRYNVNNDILYDSDTNPAGADSNTVYHNTTWSYYDSKGRLVKTASTKKDQKEFNIDNKDPAYLDLYTITTYQYQDEETNSLPSCYGNNVIRQTVRSGSKDQDIKATKTSYSIVTGDKGCTITTISPDNKISKSVTNTQGRIKEIYNEDGTAEERYVDNDGYVQRTITYAKVSENNIKYQVTGVTRNFVDLAWNTKQEITDDEYNANDDGLNFGTVKHVYVNHANNWMGTRYNTMYASNMTQNEELDIYNAKTVSYLNGDDMEIKSVSDSNVIDTICYDKIGRITETWQKDVVNQKQNSFTYSKLSRDQVYKNNEVSAPNLEKTEEVTYNENGFAANRSVNIIDFDGKIIQSTTTADNKTNDLINTYDIEGKLLSAVKVSWSGSKEQENTTTFITYDERGRVVKEETPFEANDSEPYCSKTETVYNEDDSIKEVKVVDSAIGQSETYQSTYYEYDNDGRVLLERTGANGNYNYVQYVYDSLGKICIQITGLHAKAAIKAKISDADLKNVLFDPVESCNDTDYAMTKKIYNDITGQLLREVSEDGSITEYETYNDYDQPLRVKSPNQDITEYVYDEQGRCTKKSTTSPSGEQTIETTDYYDIGKEKNTVYKEVNIVKVGVNAPVTTTKIFDNNMRLKEETTGNTKKAYQYDLEGKKTNFQISVNNQTKVNLSYAYNSFSLLEAVRNQSDTVLESYAYYADGKLQSKANPAVTTDYSYNLQGMITKLTARKTSNDELLYEERIDRNLNGQIKESTQTMGNIITDYTYDRMGRMDKISDNLGKTDHYLYDDYHNIVNKTIEEQSDNKQMVHAYYYTKTKLEELSQSVYISGSYSHTPVKGRAEYDQNGNNTYDPLTSIENTYDVNNQLRSVMSLGESAHYDYTYNSEGLMYTKSAVDPAGGFQSVYTWDEDQLVFIANASANEIYARGNGLIGRMDDNGSMSEYYISNSRGDIVRVTDQAGRVIRYNQYDENGNDITTVPAGTGFGYGGEYDDRDSKTIYLRARNYNPGTARFLQRDTYEGDEGKPTSRNLYTYCENDPINNVDPTGHWSRLTHKALCLGAKNDTIKEADAFADTKGSDKELIYDSFHGKNNSLENIKKWYKAAIDLKNNKKNDALKSAIKRCSKSLKVDLNQPAYKRNAWICLGFTLHCFQDYFAHRTEVSLDGGKNYKGISTCGSLLPIKGGENRPHWEDDKTILSFRYKYSLTYSKKIISNFYKGKKLKGISHMGTGGKVLSKKIYTNFPGKCSGNYNFTYREESWKPVF